MGGSLGRDETSGCGTSDETWELSLTQQISLRNAAYVLALCRIAEAIEAQGTREYFTSHE